ncbi:MAG: single-stranded DNA-binding protein, partial [Clostridia bacterium]|nr:single-stranded DNA-binding protein [Clostridia bacterium]
MNKVFLIGRLTQDPQTQTLDSGTTLCRFSIAVNRTYSRDGETQADFINIVAWNATAQNCGKYLVKGSQVAVSGSIQTG